MGDALNFGLTEKAIKQKICSEIDSLNKKLEEVQSNTKNYEN